MAAVELMIDYLLIMILLVNGVEFVGVTAAVIPDAWKHTGNAPAVGLHDPINGVSSITESFPAWS